MNFSPEFKKYFFNTTWMVGGRAVKMLIGFIGTAIVARYLGPEKFGLLNYCFSFIGIALVIVVMGLETIVVRELVKASDLRKEILGSALLLQTIGVIISIFILLLFHQVFHFDSESQNLILIGCISLLFRPLASIRYFFEANVEAKLIAKIEFTQAVIGILARLFLVYVKAPLGWFAFCLSLEWIILGGSFLLFYFRKFNNPFNDLFFFSKNKLIELFLYSWPLLLSAAMIILHQQIDRIMIKELLGEIGNKEVGYYSAAIRICIFVIFIPQMIANSLTPLLVDTFNNQKEEYSSKINMFMDIMNWVGIILSLILFFLAKPLILIAYGNSFIPAILILQVVAWKGFFTATGIATGRQSTIENLQKYGYLRNLIGLVVNIILNIILIPTHKALGAAYATVTSMFVANVISHLLIKPYWHIFKSQFLSFIVGWYRLLQIFIKIIRSCFVNK